MTEKFQFQKKVVFKHKDHVTLNEGDEYSGTVSHLKHRPENQGEEFVELKKNEAALQYGSKKVLRQINMKSRDKLQVEDPGLGKTPDWFKQLAPVIQWEKYRTLLYELDHLWMNMFFVRELYGEEKEGREQVVQLSKASEGREGLGIHTVCQLDYHPEESGDYEKEDVDGFIKVELPRPEKIVLECTQCGFNHVIDEGGKEEMEEEANNVYAEHFEETEHEIDVDTQMSDLDVDYKQAVWSGGSTQANGLRELLSGIALKHGYDSEKLFFQITEEDDEYRVEVLNKDFTLRFNDEGRLGTGVSPWVVELFYSDGCPIHPEEVETSG